MAARRPHNAREETKAGDPIAKPKCCMEGKKRVEDLCKIDQEEINAYIKEQEARNRRRKKRKKPTYTVRYKTWKDKHCKNTLFNYENPQIVKDRLKSLKNELDELEDDFKGVLYEFGKGAAVDKVQKVAAVGGCAALGATIGGIVGFFFGGAGAVPGAAIGAEAGAALCGAAAMADTVLDTVGSAKRLWESREQITQRVKALQSAKEQVETLQKSLTALQNASSEERKQLKKELYKKMEELIDSDPCLKVKRCELRPYKEPQAKAHVVEQGGKEHPMDAIFKLNDASGCCPGQQAHHIIPAAKMQACPDYTPQKHNQAPAVCVEGSKDSGTHGRMHDATDRNTKDMINGENEYQYHECAFNADSMMCTIEASAQAFVETFPQCDKECIEQQLWRFYGKLCKRGRVIPKNKRGEEIKRSDENNEEF